MAIVKKLNLLLRIPNLASIHFDDFEKKMTLNGIYSQIGHILCSIQKFQYSSTHLLFGYQNFHFRLCQLMGARHNCYFKN